MNPTSDDGTPNSRAARATLRPLPPGVTATSRRRRTSPGRSSGSLDVRSIVRFGPAISSAESPSARQIAAEDDLPRFLCALAVERDEDRVVLGEPLGELLHVGVARACRGEL